MEANAAPRSRLTKGERAAIIFILVGFLGFGALVEYRSAFLSRRMGDLGVYLRAGWAIRTGNNIYTVVDDNSWHYSYPPLLAILMMPLADPPPGVESEGRVPFAVSVAICYGVNLLCLVGAVHLLAGALEKTSSRPEVRRPAWFSSRWWWLRLLPILCCLPPIGHTLMRGQMNLLLLALLCGWIADMVCQRRLRAGIWLAGAICLKIFPVYLLLVPAWRRDWRGLTGCLIGLTIGLGVIPAAALGPQRTVKCYQELAEVLIWPALRMGKDQSRAKELIEVTATDSQSFLATIHNTLHLDRNTRPNVASDAVRRTHWLLGAVFTALTLVAGRRATKGPALVIFAGALILIMILLSPVCHLHYFALSVPLVIGLLAWSWEKQAMPRLSGYFLALMGVEVIGNTLPLLPHRFEFFKDTGLAMYAALVLWLVGCVVLCRTGWRRVPTANAGPRWPLAA
jgi:alpha-1,2-mannosyltransferase